MKKIPVSFRLDEDLYQFIKVYAQSGRMTMTQVLVNLVLDFYEKNQNGAHGIRMDGTQTRPKWKEGDITE